jgi:hypothetical protein
LNARKNTRPAVTTMLARARWRHRGVGKRPVGKSRRKNTKSVKIPGPSMLQPATHDATVRWGSGGVILA